ncbi:DUF1134 domain-containing protein [Pelagerythrobacter marinus]|uniref:DUF1134 domain-containing protein n=1 Tax=Pelagerythrobacter marinus TaxID=538382 RepID=UPI002036EE05|nr:DUF1134 domain-containing protein [Pelagerythrobacter marinus]USA38691.1 DUF1134 domain-containing protein [Pelagerythrobacter marinus]WPZ07282.1 DUF1134 domain-containing protein [Pelagerythrobacter marinus]
MQIIATIRGTFAALAGAAALAAAPLAAQTIETFDPDTAIDGDLMERPGDQPVYAEPQPTPDTAATGPGDDAVTYSPTPPADAPVAPAWSDPSAATAPAAATAPGIGPVSPAARAGSPQVAAASDTYKEDDLIGAAEGVFGKGAEGVARMIEDLLEKQGEPNAYIVGREAGGAFVVGARYGSGTLYHKVEGQRPVYWTGPSIGFDVGANAGNTFVLVYNLYDSEELYERYPAGEGQAYVVGGLTASYLRKGDVVLIPIRVGAGLRLGVNAGYMKFSKKQRWLPF